MKLHIKINYDIFLIWVVKFHQMVKYKRKLNENC